MQARIYVATMTREDLVQAWRVVEETGVGAAACSLLGVAVLGYDRQVVEIEVVAIVMPSRLALVGRGVARRPCAALLAQIASGVEMA